MWGRKEGTQAKETCAEAMGTISQTPLARAYSSLPFMPRLEKEGVSASGQQVFLQTLSSSWVIVKSRRGNRRYNGHGFQMPKLSSHCS